MKKINIYLCIVTFIFAACEKTIEISKTEHKPVTIINGLISPGKPVEVTVTRTKHYSDTKPMPKVTNATVELYKDDKLVEELTHQEDGTYRGNHTPAADATYKIKVTDEKHHASATTTIPVPVQLLKISYEHKGEKQGSKQTEVTMSFKDPGDQNNYYRISVEATGDDAEEKNELLVIYTNDVVLKATYGEDDVFSNPPSNSYQIFRDKLINGKTYDLKFTLHDLSVLSEYNASGETISKSYKVNLHSITREYYLYLKSKELSQWSSDDPFSEPVPIFSNVSGGGGIITSYSLSSQRLKVDYPSSYFSW
ncbi:DUF4249 domain-containing protein [Puteibacter caeruleilacunae]|nr:DUF4249 domain-containing protein [Puteibacter caeruleilacunae]